MSEPFRGVIKPTLQKLAAVDVSAEVFLDLEKEAAGALARD